MNRIILIGNGFDLAHGLKTSYKDFIDNYWEGFMYNCIYQDVQNINGHYKYDCIELMFTRGLTLSHFLPDGENRYISPHKKPISYNELKEKLNQYKEEYKNSAREIGFIITNGLLKHLLEISKAKTTWVDIENEYYKYLIYQFDKKKHEGYYYGQTSVLNEDFEYIKQKLNDYLFNLTEKKEYSKSERINEIINSEIALRDFTDIGKKDIANDEYYKVAREQEGVSDSLYPEISEKTRPLMEDYGNYSGKELEEQILYDLKDGEKASMYFDLKIDKTLYLNFNYTNTIHLYYNVEDDSSELNHIHGEVNNTDNPIIFGYGDELEENYSKLENLQDNCYLENIKSIKYQETPNYKQMLDFINSEKYQVIILGHSCGNSDRTLLNTLFEHENCVSIKPYYFLYEDEKTGEIKDNYSDIVRNISRNFTNKKSMRDKVVNKTYTTWFSKNIDCPPSPPPRLQTRGSDKNNRGAASWSHPGKIY